MRQLIRDHKVPLGVTAGGLLVVLGLATAPVIMAESESEILTRKNTADIASITEMLEARAAELQQDFDARSSSHASAIASIENQISILNKATSRIHSRQVSILQPTGEIRSSIDSLEDKADLRMANLERAVTRLHLNQQDKSADSSADASDSETANRLDSLENDVRLLLESQSRPQAGHIQIGQSAEVSASSTDPRGAIAEDAAALRERIALLEREVRLSRVERSLSRLGKRLESIEGSGSDRTRANVQLQDIKSYIDGLLTELEP